MQSTICYENGTTTTTGQLTMILGQLADDQADHDDAFIGGRDFQASYARRGEFDLRVVEELH